MSLVLSPKFKDFLSIKCEREYLEGTTAAGKTTVGIFKFMCIVAGSKKKFHIIAGADKGTVEKNIINAENGLLEQFEGIAEYYPSGKGKITLPHIEYETSDEIKIIYVCGYDNKKRWEKVLGGQVGCVFIDEVNIADMEFLREITHRCDYMMTASNPDDPNNPVYKEFINKSRPLKKYEKDYPAELLNELREPHIKGWVHWYFTFYDNASLTKEQIQKKIDAVPVGTKMYKNKIQGLRGKATGLVFKYSKENIITKEQTKEMKFIYYSCGVDTSYSKQTHDKLTFTLVGITLDRKCVVLKNKEFNNKDRTVPFAPSDVIPMLIQFLEECKIEYGFVKTTYIDSADTATIAEAQKYKRLTGCIYDFEGAWKKKTNIVRVQFQQSWLHTKDFLIVDECVPYVHELDVYSFNEDGTLEDGNDHSIQGGQYAWLPYITKIGNYEELMKIIKDKEDKNGVV